MKKLSTKAKIIYGIIGLFLITGVVVPQFWPDAANKYTGIKKEVGLYAVGNAWSKLSGIDYASVAGTIKISVEDVSVGGPNEKRCSGEFQSLVQPELGDHFTATVAYRTFFGIKMETAQFPICVDRK